LVYDADAGGTTGVDRALQLFIREDVDLGIAALPDGLDPFDLIVSQGAAPFRAALDAAKNALDFKIDQLLARADGDLEANRRAADGVLGMLALVPESAGAAAAMKVDLVLHRLSHRLGLRLATLRARLAEARRDARARSSPAKAADEATGLVPRPVAGRAEPFERELAEVLLAAPELVPAARAEIPASEVRHPGLMRLVQGLYELMDEGSVPDLDGLRLKIADNPALADRAMRYVDVGRLHPDKPAWLREIASRFRERRDHERTRSLQGKLSSAADHEAAMELLRKLQQRKAPPDGLSAGGG
jgi:DNA primase